MMTPATVVLAAIAVILLLSALRQWRRTRVPRLPQVPGLPWLGNVLQLSPNYIHLCITDWAAKYGPVFSLSLFGERIVVVNDYITIREVLAEKSRDFAGRPNFFRMDFVNYFKGNSLIFSDFSNAVESQKQEVMRALRLRPEARRRHEANFTNILENLVNQWKHRNAEPFDPLPSIRKAVLDSMASMLTGTPLTNESAELYMALEDRLFAATQPGGWGSELDIMPWLARLPLPNATLTVLRESRDTMMEWAQMLLKRSQPEFAMAALNKKELDNFTPTEDESFFKSIVIRDLMIAGITNTTHLLHSFVGICIVRPDVQQRIHKELHSITDASEANKEECPYTYAAILESLRYFSHMAMTVPHKTLRETQVAGYAIPQNTQVWINLWALHHDHTIWGDPFIFRPERFLGNDGKLLPADHHLRNSLLIFGTGARVCIGKKIALDRIFKFLTTIIGHFRFESESTETLPETDPRKYRLDCVLHTPQFKCKAVGLI